MIINLKKLNKNVTSNKNKTCTCWKWIKGLSKKLKKYQQKGLPKDLINKFSILNGAKYFSPGIPPNFLVFNGTTLYWHYSDWFVEI